jgi:hypothetical protein
MPPWLAWILWTGGGAVVAAGLALCCWGLFADRPRGRRRCPRCWYEMAAGVGLTCSECGQRARSERRLRKIRRRWWAARLGGLIAALGAAVAMLPVIHRQGWVSLLPTTPMILAMPALEGFAPDAAEELSQRFGEGRPWDWQWRLLAWRLDDPAEPLWDVAPGTPQSWPQDLPLAGTPTVVMSPAAWKWIGRPARVQLVSRFDSAAGPIFVERIDPAGIGASAASGGHRTAHGALAMGRPPNGASALEFDAVLERCVVGRGGEDPRWIRVDTRRLRIPIEVRGRLEDRLRPDGSEALREALLRHTRFHVDNRALRIVLGADELLSDDLACPTLVELCRDGEPLVTWRDWWCPADRPPDEQIVHRLPATLRGARRPFGSRDYAGHAWSLRVRGDGSRALLEALRGGPSRYWAGSFEVPLELADAELELAYRGP